MFISHQLPLLRIMSNTRSKVFTISNQYSEYFYLTFRPQWGEPIYIANPNSNGCSTTEDCSSVVKGYVCLTSGFRQGLCSYTDDTTTIPTTTTPTTPAPGTSAPSKANPISGTGKTTSAAGSTKSTGTTKETESSSTVATTTSQSDYIIKLINEMRAQVAAGNISTLYGPLPSSLHMFQLVRHQTFPSLYFKAMY
ncbi:unnamed protein product [Haemonchus placei]|uniref:EGF-like domain-containing protein n=1 Tax=Haemonchus placei TaxID=6290 RepID=A0A0N4X363_HAEPC|nr:unnamed protein product [Haemonchus placei]